MLEKEHFKVGLLGNVIENDWTVLVGKGGGCKSENKNKRKGGW